MNQDHIKKIVEEIFTHTNCILEACEFADEDGMLWCMITTPDSRFLIGRDGETLRSLNHLIRKMVEQTMTEEESAKVYIDINGYQKKYFDNLRATAHMMAERARYFKSTIALDPMPAFDRRIVHMFLESARDLKTESEGQGADRKVVITYIGE